MREQPHTSPLKNSVATRDLEEAAMRGNVIRSLRIIASFSLLGTVLFGVLFHNLSYGVDAHLIGAGVGTVAGITIKALRRV